MKKLIIILISMLFFSQAQGYEFHGKNYKIEVPENITHLEYCYFSNSCEVSEKYQKLIFLNTLLIKKGYNPIYK